VGLRPANYTANLLNQYSQRTVPGYVDILGVAFATNLVYVNGQIANRKGEYFWKELSMNNTTGSVWQPVAVTATGLTTVTGNVFVARTPEVFSYDLDGNMTSDGRWNYTWDSENRLVKVESRSDTPQASWRRVEWQYDALGRRIRQITSDGSSGSWVVTEDLKFVSDPMLFGRHILELRSTDNAPVQSYSWGLDLSGTMDGAGGVGGLLWVTLHTVSGPAAGTHFAAYDGNGNVVALVSATTGNETSRYENGPFGEPIRVTGLAATLNPFRFSTKRTNPTTDLVLYEYRAYSPSLGRWPNRDPIGEFGGLNEYGFSANSPLNLIDLLGLQYRPKLVSGSPFSDSDKIRHFPYKMHYRFSATPTDSSLNVRAWVYGERWIVVWILSGAANVDTTISIICLGDGKITYSATGRSSDKDGVAQAVVAYNPVPLDEKTLSIHAVASGAVSADGGPEIKLGDVISISWPSPGLERTVQLGGFVWRCECGK